MIGALLGAGGAALSAITGTLIAKLVTEKVIIRISLILMDKLVKSTKNKLDDELFKAVKEALE